MMRKILTVTGALLLVIAFSMAISTPGNGLTRDTFSLPDQAAEVAPGVYYLGTSTEDGRTVEGYAFVRFDDRRGYHHKPNHDKGNGGKGGGTDDGADCYAFMAKNAKWRTAENYLVDPTNTEGLDESFVRANIAEDIDKWETAAGTDIFGSEVSGTVDGADANSQDGKNEVMFGSIDQNGAIAVTIVWGVFRGPPHQRELVEWDQVYDQQDFDWSSSGEAGKMDFENIATHEIGHAAGMDHPDDTCTEQTMFAYAGTGETKKRTLETGDTTGAATLY